MGAQPLKTVRFIPAQDAHRFPEEVRKQAVLDAVAHDAARNAAQAHAIALHHGMRRDINRAHTAMRNELQAVENKIALLLNDMSFVKRDSKRTDRSAEHKRALATYKDQIDRELLFLTMTRNVLRIALKIQTPVRNPLTKPKVKVTLPLTKGNPPTKPHPETNPPVTL